MLWQDETKVTEKLRLCYVNVKPLSESELQAAGKYIVFKIGCIAG